jgi:hypothetical protein
MHSQIADRPAGKQTGSGTPTGNHPLQDYQMQLMLLKHPNENAIFRLGSGKAKPDITKCQLTMSAPGEHSLDGADHRSKDAFNVGVDSPLLRHESYATVPSLARLPQRNFR